jgi:hypothetical protein
MRFPPPSDRRSTAFPWAADASWLGEAAAAEAAAAEAAVGRRALQKRLRAVPWKEPDIVLVQQVKKAPSWANFRSYSCMLTGMHGPTCIFWANLTPFSLQPEWWARLQAELETEWRESAVRTDHSRLPGAELELRRELEQLGHINQAWLRMSPQESSPGRHCHCGRE